MVNSTQQSQKSQKLVTRSVKGYSDWFFADFSLRNMNHRENKIKNFTTQSNLFKIQCNGHSSSLVDHMRNGRGFYF